MEIINIRTEISVGIFDADKSDRTFLVFGDKYDSIGSRNVCHALWPESTGLQRHDNFKIVIGKLIAVSGRSTKYMNVRH